MADSMRTQGVFVLNSSSDFRPRNTIHPLGTSNHRLRGSRLRPKVWVALLALGLIGCAIQSARAQDRISLPLKPIRVIQSKKAQSKNKIRNVSVVEYEKLETSQKDKEVTQYAIDQAHAGCFSDDKYPSAKQCAECHPKHYREWSVSPHAYAQISPIFNCMQNAVNILTNGTNADFCIRCHSPVGMNLGEKITMPQADRHPAAREGITCIACHRINQDWGKGAGRRALVPGGIHDPIYGPLGAQILAKVLADPDKYGVMKTDDEPNVRGRDIHRDVVPFFKMSTPSFCGSCHDVFAPNGFRLEDAFSEYKDSPAAKKEGVTCQDCHMGKVPGENGGYFNEGIAQLGNITTPARKRTNHMFAGPDYSIVHPGIFPHNPAAMREEGAGEEDLGLATMREWLTFEYKKGWGTNAFEAKVPQDYKFPDAWKDASKRRQAANIIKDQHKLLAEARVQSRQVLAAAYKISEIQDMHSDSKGLHFNVKFWNGTNGHGVPTGFDAERLVFLQVVVWDRNRKIVFMSGDLDPNGDVRDSHSFYVHNGKLPSDHQLFSLQSKFITRNIRGGEREQILPINFSADPLPFVRPARRPFTILGRPLGARKHKQLVEVGGHRWAKYHVPKKWLTGRGPYQVNVRLKAGMVPVNLIHRISIAGFDYGLSPKEVARRVVDGHIIVQEKCATFHVHENK